VGWGGGVNYWASGGAWVESRILNNNTAAEAAGRERRMHSVKQEPEALIFLDMRQGTGARAGGGGGGAESRKLESTGLSACLLLVRRLVKRDGTCECQLKVSSGMRRTLNSVEVGRLRLCLVG